MSALMTALRFDVVVQARNGFYWASGFVVLTVGGLLVAIPEPARADSAAWVPALLTVNLQVTTFFFVAGLMLLEREEGTLGALAVSPFSSGAYLATRVITLTALAAVESIAMVWIAFGLSGSWLLILAGTAALGVVYTCFGAAVACRYGSVNALLLPASLFVGLLLLPLLGHFGFAPRTLFLLHPIEPALRLLRAGYGTESSYGILFGMVGSLVWGTVACRWAKGRVDRLMRDTRPGGGR